MKSLLWKNLEGEEACAYHEMRYQTVIYLSYWGKAIDGDAGRAVPFGGVRLGLDIVTVIFFLEVYLRQYIMSPFYSREW